MKKIVLSRTDNLGDVILTLPLAGVLKKHSPQSQITFIGKKYTEAVIKSSRHIDIFLDREDVIASPELLKSIKADVIIHVFPDKEIAKTAKKAGIPLRIGTSHRLFHLLYCNKLVNFSRKNSPLHEAQLNCKLAEPLGITIPSLAEIPLYYGMEASAQTEVSLNTNKFNLILHPKSKGSAREWPLEYFEALIKNLPEELFSIYITGTEKEGELIKQQHPSIFNYKHVTDLTGKFSMEGLINFINQADGLVACSTGPLHIAAALGKYACGIYPPMKPLHPGRWAPLGKKAMYIVLEKDCFDCKKNMNCTCIQSILPTQVLDVVKQWNKAKIGEAV